MKKLIIILIVLLLLGMTGLWWTSRYKQVSSSMSPTIDNGQVVLINKFSKNVNLGDIIVFKHPKDSIDSPDQIWMSRVIGLPGDVIEIKDNSVYRNNEKLNESYLDKKGMTFVRNAGLSKYEVPENMYFVLCDNRSHCNDSRSFLKDRATKEQNPYIHKDKIIGKVVK